MRATTDDGRFGVVLARTKKSPQRWFFAYQLVIDGTVIGDDDPAIPYTAVMGLLRLKRLDDPRLAAVSGDPDATLTVLRADDVLNDSSLAGNAESLDGWDVRAFRHGAEVTWLARPIEGSGRGTRRTTLSVTIPDDEYAAIAAAVVAYHQALTERPSATA